MATDLDQYRGTHLSVRMVVFAVRYGLLLFCQSRASPCNFLKKGYFVNYHVDYAALLRPDAEILDKISTLTTPYFRVDRKQFTRYSSPYLQLTNFSAFYLRG